MNKYVEEFLSLYDNNEEIPEWLIHKVYTISRIVDEDFGDNDRWTREVTSIIEVPIDSTGNYRMFAVFWQQGLTEYQENIWCTVEEVEQSFEEVTKTFKIYNRDYRSKRTGEIQLTMYHCKEIE